MNINHQNIDTLTALHEAVASAHWSVVECLVGWGAALDLVSSDGNTPLHLVVKSKSAVIPESPQLVKVKNLERKLRNRNRSVCIMFVSKYMFTIVGTRRTQNSL